MRFRFFNLNSLLLKASYFNGIIVVIKALSGIISTMVVGRIIGPSGLALLGNLRNFLQTVSSFTAEGYQNGTIRYVSEYEGNSYKQNQTIANVFQLSIAVALLFGIVLFSFSSFWSDIIFNTHIYKDIIRLIAIGLPFLSFNLLLIYIFNGLEQHKKLVVLNTIMSVGNMSVVVALVFQYNLKGALMGVVIGPVLVFFLMLLGLGKDRSLLLNLFKLNFFSVDVIKSLSGYLLMTIYSTAIVSVTYLMIRNLIISNLSVQQAGYWEAMNRLSSFYVMFFISMTSFYLLPKLSKTKAYHNFKEELKKFYILSIPLLIITFSLIYFLRTVVLQTLLGDEFIPTEGLFFWQLIGDFIAIIAIALVKQFHAKRMIKAYLICNGLKSVLHLSLCYILIDSFGLESTVIAYAISYMLYLILVIFFIVNYFKPNKSA